MLHFILGILVGVVLFFISIAIYFREYTLGELKDYGTILRKNKELKHAISMRIPDLENRISEIENSVEEE